MREILFRGKRANNGEWVEGSLICYADGCTFICVQGENMDFLAKFAVIPETVGQYTGLTDKTGKKIFEGDIVKAYNTLGEDDGIGVVHWSDLFVAWHMADCKCMYSSEIASYEVIGNIHDNPELWEAMSDDE